jgi:hypothetical protein
MPDLLTKKIVLVRRIELVLMRIIREILLGILSGIVAWFIAQSIGYYVFGTTALQITTTIIYAIIGVSVTGIYIYYKKWIALGAYVFCFILTYPPVILVILSVIGCAIGECLVI